MSDHVAGRLALAAAAELDAEERTRVESHLRECPACAGEAAAWRRLAEELGRLPAPKAPRALVERTRAAVEDRLGERAEQAWNRVALGFLVAFAWTTAVAAWLVLDLLAGGLALWLARPVVSTAALYAAYLVAGWMAAGAAAVLIGRRAREQGRFS